MPASSAIIQASTSAQSGQRLHVGSRQLDKCGKSSAEEICMKIRILIDKTTALKAGKDNYGRAVVDVPAESLTPEQRNELAEHTWLSGEQPVADYYLCDDPVSLQASRDVAEATPDAIRLILDRLIAARRERKAAEEAEKAKKAAEVAEFKRKFAENPSIAITDEYRKFYPASLLLCNHADLAEEKKWAESECARLNAEQNEKEKREREEEKAKKEAGKAALKEWAGEHGSDLLKARIADGFHWEGLAEHEWSESLVAFLGKQIESADTVHCIEESTTPSLDKIHRLRDVRGRLPANAAAALAWLTYDGEEGRWSRTELKVTVTCPTGRELEYFYPAE